MDFCKEFGLLSKQFNSVKESIYPEETMEMTEQQSNPFYLESCAAYMFHKILSNKNYGLGNLIHTSINNFNNTYELASNIG